jgi:hypothetical protein
MWDVVYLGDRFRNGLFSAVNKLLKPDHWWLEECHSGIVSEFEMGELLKNGIKILSVNISEVCRTAESKWSGLGGESIGSKWLRS